MSDQSSDASNDSQTRNTRIKASSEPFHGHYNHARDITKAIDELVEALTYNQERFWAKRQV